MYVSSTNSSVITFLGEIKSFQVNCVNTTGTDVLTA